MQSSVMYGIINFHDEFTEFGYFTMSSYSIPIIFQGNVVWLCDYRIVTKQLFFRNSMGCYTLAKELSDNLKMFSRLCNCYPVQRKYNLSKINTSKVKIPKVDEDNILSKLPFTIGLEFETSKGNIPWIDLHQNALVPLYDGSISGHEYVTLPLTMKQVPIIKNYCELLHKYTEYDINCSLHIHFGGFPIKYDKIERLCHTWIIFQKILMKFIPKWSYCVEQYKGNGKAYNKPLIVRNLKEFCYETTGNVIDDDDDFYRNNQYDEDEERKWNVHGRYYNMNIMHLISGQNHKTVEFRFLRPTYHYNEIKTYILLLGAYLNWVINSDDEEPTIENILSVSFNENECEVIKYNLSILSLLTKTQINHRDFAGIDDYKKNVVFDLMPFDYENVPM